MVVLLEIIMRENSLIHQPQSERVTKDRPELLQEVQSKGRSPMTIRMHHSKEGIEVILPQG